MNGPYTITYVSVRDARENRINEEFTTVTDAQKYVRREFRDLPVYWRVWIYDSDGCKVITGTRSGYNSTGKRWIFERCAEDE
jgi:hypothetical protein